MNAKHKVCESVQDDLKAFLDGELGWLARRSVDRHVRSCGECARVLDELRGLTESMRAVEEIEASAGFGDRVLEQVKEAQQMQAARAVSPLQRRLRVWYATGGAVVAAAVMIAVLYPMMARAPESARHLTTGEAFKPAARSEAVEQGARKEAMTSGGAPSAASPPESELEGKRADLGTVPAGEAPSVGTLDEEAREKAVASGPGEAGTPLARTDLHAKKEIPAAKDLDKLNVATGKGASFEYQRQVIRTGAVSLEVKDAERAMDRIGAIAVSLGGFVQDSSVGNDEEAPSAGSATIRIPSVSFDEALRRLSELGKVLDKNTKGEDVTAQLVDLEARLKNLRAEEQQYVKILAKAHKVSEILSVEYELERIRGEIEQAEGQRAYLTKRVDLSTIVVAFSEKEEKKPEPSAWNVGSTMRDSGLAFLSFARGLTKALIWILVFCPVWFPILLLFRYLYRVASGPVPAANTCK
jgi:anti-sigma factor RsiW